MRHLRQSIHPQKKQPLRVGFVPLCDCAPLVMAGELGLFERHGLYVELRREVGWATIRDKILYGELEAALAPAGLVLAANFGWGCVAAPCCTALIINLHGNAITVSRDFWRRSRGEDVAAGLRNEILRRRDIRRMVFGTVSPVSSHTFLLHEWFRSLGIDANLDVEILTVPPPQMASHLKSGYLDGYCAGEPWNAMAVLQKSGIVVATSSELSPGHPEKSLMVRADFAGTRSLDHLRLIAALLEACRFCDAPENRERIVETLAQAKYLDVPAKALNMSLRGSFDFGEGRIEKIRDLHCFFRQDANRPTAEKAQWVLRSLQDSPFADEARQTPAADVEALFREDLFQDAIALTYRP